MSATVPIIASSSSTISLPSREMTGTRLFQFYMESFFKIPKDLKNDIIYCQRALKAHIKVHQMVLDVFQQQPDADPQQKKRILDELETEIYEINAEQHFLFLRLRRIIDEFYKMLKKNGIPIDPSATNALVSREIAPHICDTNMEIQPITIMYRYTEEKLIEKYFEVQKDQQQHQQQLQHQQQQQLQQQQQQRRQKQQYHQQQQLYQNYNDMEVIELDDDDGSVVDKVAKVHGKYRGSKREHPSSTLNCNNEGLMRNFNAGFNAALARTSLLKPMNQRMPHELMTVDVKPKLGKSSAATATTLADIYKQTKEEKEKPIELPVSTNVKMSRLNLRQALKRAQAAVRGPVSTATVTQSIPPPPPPLPPAPQILNTQHVEVFKKSSLAKTKAARAAAAATATAALKSPERSSSSEEGTPERGPTPPHNYWPDELEETRTKADEYGQEMFLKMFDLFTPEVHAQMQQRRSKRRRRCVQNTNYHYGKVEHPPSSTANEPDTKKKRKAFLLSPQVKKALPAKPRAKRRSADNVSETNSVPPSRSASSSPDDKRTCNECLKGGYNLEQCVECKLYYHAECHRENDNPTIAEDPKQLQNETKLCPPCQRKQDKIIQEKILINKNLQCCVQDLELQLAQEKDRREILQRTGKSYKVQMNNLFKIVNAFKADKVVTSATSSNADNSDDNDDNYETIHLD